MSTVRCTHMGATRHASASLDNARADDAYGGSASLLFLTAPRKHQQQHKEATATHGKYPASSWPTARWYR